MGADGSAGTISKIRIKDMKGYISVTTGQKNGAAAECGNDILLPCTLR